MRPAYRRYALGVMMAVYSLNLIDRGLMMLLLQPIKEDLRLSDSQLGLVTGVAFASFYAVLGLPIARWADRGNRVTITSLSIGLWGMTVMTTVAVTSFIQLLGARIAAAIGEAGCKPPTYSMVGDYYPRPSERSRAMALYFAGGPLAALVSFGVGGWIGEHYGWRMAFFLMGIPGLLLAVLVKLTLVEPRTPIAAGSASTAPQMSSVLSLLWRRRSLRHLCIAVILLYMIAMGFSPWYAAFLMRTHHMGTAELGVWLGLVAGVGGMAGTLSGGYVASRWFGENALAQVRMNALIVAALMPCSLVFLTAGERSWALTALVPLFMAFNASFGPTYALMQRLVPDTMRATMMSLVMLLANLIGMGIGPQAVGILSDLLTPACGSHALRYAMLCMSFIALGSAYHFWRAGRDISDDLAAAQRVAQTQTRV